MSETTVKATDFVNFYLVDIYFGLFDEFGDTGEAEEWTLAWLYGIPFKDFKEVFCV